MKLVKSATARILKEVQHYERMCHKGAQREKLGMFTVGRGWLEAKGRELGGAWCLGGTVQKHQSVLKEQPVRSERETVLSTHFCTIHIFWIVQQKKKKKMKGESKSLVSPYLSFFFLARYCDGPCTNLEGWYEMIKSCHRVGGLHIPVHLFHFSETYPTTPV